MNYLIKSNYGKGNLQAIQTCKELAELIPPPGEELVFDFKHFRENNPFGNLIIINSLKRFKQSYSDASLFCRPKEQNGYLSHIGFYKACGINYGKDPGEAIASSNYVPITNINLYSDDFYRDIEKRSLELWIVYFKRTCTYV